jgi:hypothetical protein
LKKGIIFSAIYTLVWDAKRGFVDPLKVVPMKKITLSRVEINHFLQGIFPKNICRTRDNILVLVLRFLWLKLTLGRGQTVSLMFMLAPENI